ncbi:hypothetical protein SPW_7365 [Streptomyces sp. W007]|uniref:hypothetical protein n=1 Tax=Streptomyces sp. W007 TaxID=1055352 RepID=UPI000241A794|nr:hypothetical protein [Streptomyces sp. W007]EHM24271.1 hypothetical protein SPW_7365 [Streptomyces sp. W007]
MTDYYGVYARQDGKTVCEIATIGRGVTREEAQMIADELQEEFPLADIWIGTGLSVAGPGYTTLLIPARDLRRGDEFELHRRTRTAAYDAVKTIRGSIRVAFTNGGEAYLPADQEIRVSRPTTESLCATG